MLVLRNVCELETLLEELLGVHSQLLESWRILIFQFLVNLQSRLEVIWVLSFGEQVKFVVHALDLVGQDGLLEVLFNLGSSCMLYFDISIFLHYCLS